MGTQGQLFPRLSLHGVRASSCAADSSLRAALPFAPASRSSAVGRHIRIMNTSATPALHRGLQSRLSCSLWSRWSEEEEEEGAAVSSVPLRAAWGQGSLCRRQRLADRFCMSRAVPAGSLRDDEMRAERCHPRWFSIKYLLARAGERRRGELGKQGQAGQPPAAEKCIWERWE